MSARFAQQDYAGALLGLLPTGRVWPKDLGSVQGQVAMALAKTYERSDAAAIGVLREVFPATTVDLLTEWEDTLGLPDPCAGPDPTIPQRQAQVVSRLTGGGGQSRAHFIAFAAALGFTITITTYYPFRAGRGRAGDPVASDLWAFVWGVTVVANAGGLSVDVLMCELETIKPAESYLLLLV